LNENRGEFTNFVEIWGIHKFCRNREEIYNFGGNREEYALCIIGSGEWAPLTVTVKFGH